MTVEEALRNVEACEAQVRGSYAELRENVRRAGANAVETASCEKIKRTVVPLLLCVIGLFLLSGPWFLGILLIAGGAYLSYRLHGPARTLQNEIGELEQALDAAVRDRTDI